MKEVTATITQYSDWHWDDFDFDPDPEPVECLKETDVQQKIDFTERKTTLIGGVSYWVTEGNSPLTLVEKIDMVGEPIEQDELVKDWVSYKFSYSLAPASNFVLKNVHPPHDPPDPPEVTKVPRRKHLRISPHAKFTREILRRPNAKGR